MRSGSFYLSRVHNKADYGLNLASTWPSIISHQYLSPVTSSKQDTNKPQSPISLFTNSLALRIFECNFRYAICKLFWWLLVEVSLVRLPPWNLTHKCYWKIDVIMCFFDNTWNQNIRMVLNSIRFVRVKDQPYPYISLYGTGVILRFAQGR